MSVRIALLSWRDTSHPDGGGAERYLERIAERLARAGHEVTLVCARHGDAPSDETVDGVRVRRRGGRLSVYPRGLAYLLTREGRRQDVVVDVVNGVPFAAGLVRRRGLVVLVHHLHREQWDMIYPGWPGRLGWFVESRLTPLLYRRTRHVTVSRSTADDLVGLGIAADRITVVRNGVDPVAAPGRPGPEPRLCVLARLVPHKRVEHALAVLAALLPTHPALRLDVIGTGWWESRVRERCADLGVQDAVTFHGFVGDGERDRLVAAALAMLVPSVREGWGLAVIEAAAVGTPSIGYRGAGGVTESIVDGVTGLLVADLDAMVVATASLLEDGALRERLGRAASQRAAAFDWEATAAAFAAVLQDEARVSGCRTGRSARRAGSWRGRRWSRSRRCSRRRLRPSRR